MALETALKALVVGAAEKIADEVAHDAQTLGILHTDTPVVLKRKLAEHGGNFGYAALAGF